jgi:AcrR family transcriptional regulator
MTDDHRADSDKLTKGERTRRQLIDIAIKQFGRNGYRGTSVSEITREAGLTQAASYAYFPNKEALYREAVNADAAALMRHANERTRDTPVRQLLPSVLVHLVAVLDDHPLATRVLSGQEPEGMAKLGGLRTLDSTRGGLAERIAEGQRRGEVRADIDPDVIATGAQTITLALLMSITRFGVSGGAAAPEGGRDVPQDVILGVLAALDAMLAPPSADERRASA